jgi:DNA polymerase-3 subunit gamma/tau
MRFDLPRVSSEKLVEHFANISQKENVDIEQQALKIIAGAAEGSVRDGLSLLDQAIAISAGEKVTCERVQSMLGMADKEQIYNLLENIFDCKYENALAILSDIYSKGNDPIIVLKDLLEITHILSLAKISESILRQNYISELERIKSTSIISKYGVAELSRMWQILNKGIEEARFCPSPLMAAEMVIIRACYASSLPTPQEIINLIEKSPEEMANNSKNVKSINSSPENNSEKIESLNLSAEKKTLNSSPNKQTSSLNNNILSSVNTNAAIKQTFVEPNEPITTTGTAVPASFKELVYLFISKNENVIASWLEDAKVIDYNSESGILKIMSSNTPSFINFKDISKKIVDWTGKRFVISLENMATISAKSINDEKKEELENRKKQAINSEAVQSILDNFEGSEIIEIKEIFN